VLNTTEKGAPANAKKLKKEPVELKKKKRNRTARNEKTSNTGADRRAGKGVEIRFKHWGEERTGRFTRGTCQGKFKEPENNAGGVISQSAMRV